MEDVLKGLPSRQVTKEALSNLYEDISQNSDEATTAGSGFVSHISPAHRLLRRRNNTRLTHHLTRRNFLKVIDARGKGSKQTGSAEVALDCIRKLNAIEKTAREGKSIG